ncbi:MULTISPECIES: Cna B-type domain-containing protein [Lactococcus]|uniref:Cna B-type domain-containing protein n=1 Tax=Lactococcus TaxID=1357 RepID=UPI00254C02FD|nr:MULTISPECIES: Cna B-type domain-containing protein [Lactococcus]
MKKIIHLFCLSILLLTYLLIPITSIAQTQTGIISSDAKSTEQSIEREAEIEANTQRPKVNTTGNSQFLGTEEKKDSIIKSTEAQPRAPGVRAVGDDPGITIDAPANIDSNGQVVLNVDVNASAGNMSQDGVIQITIPKSIVTGDLTSQIQLPSPFYLDNPAYIDDGNGNYVLNIKYNASDIDQSQAVDFNFKIVFNAPVFTDHSTVPENVDFNANLVIDGEQKSNDSDSSKTIPTGNGKTAFLKYTMAHSDGNGHYIMDPNNPSANQFIITVNYNAQSYSDVTVTDEMPEGLSLADTYPVFSTTTGDLTPVKHLNITKVVFNPNGGFTAESVTQQFENQISSDGKTFSVHLGKLTPTDSYVISYGASVNQGYDYTNFGIEFNQAVMNNNNQPIFNSNVPLTMVDNSPSATALIKSVDKKDLATTEAKLKYTLTLNNKEGEIKAGTVVSDPLPKNTTYLSTSEHKGFSEATYDSNTNTVSYTLLEDIPQGSSRSIQLVVDCSNPNFKIGDTIINKAGFTANGTIIYSNDATTLISSSAVLKKLDSESNMPLAGAEFKVVDANGDVVIEHLITNQNGEVRSGLLKPGNYSFIETKAPEGYVLDKTPNNFKVVEGQTTSVQLAMKNTKQSFIVITGKKTWDDNNNQDGVRPNSITVNLLANGQVIDTKEVTAEDEWKYSFINLPKYENGKEIVYTITEDSIPSYTTEIKNFDIINHYTPKQTSVTVTKHWDDNNDQEGLRPDSIQVQLYANGEKTGVPINLSRDSDWNYTWKDLSTKIEGKDVLYTVKEITKVNGYETTIDNSNKGNIIITNKYKVIPKLDNNKSNPKRDTHKVEPSLTHDALPEAGENEIMTLMSVWAGLILLMVALIASVFHFKRFKINK